MAKNINYCAVNTAIMIEPYELLDSSHSMTLSEYRIFQYLIGTIFIKEGIDRDIYYTIDIKDYAEFFNIENKSAYWVIEDFLGSGRTPYVEVSEKLFNPDAKNTTKRVFTLYDGIKSDLSVGYVGVRFSSSIIELYNNLGKDQRYYAKYMLDCTRKMKSINSIRLFRLMNKWKLCGKCSFTVVELRRLLGFIAEEYAIWDNLRRKVLIPSIADINKFTDIAVEFTPISKGRKVVSVDFTIKPKGNRERELNTYGMALDYS